MGEIYLEEFCFRPAR